ncbi:DUF885 family protein [Thalassotalea sp. PP2-459]|uniref:DUF885 domain-containing protein n=1 Tax=Thalassotalea sp. PP2-459 TaxID=1742724 RepID=UPI000943A59E|nr:DUF885 domain-containing protein [Thalassotalea sp. PP2-459]OKY25138.1 hypothetical protein BI291_03745 [Thalassotalea sp. PP2-459]
MNFCSLQYTVVFICLLFVSACQLTPIKPSADEQFEHTVQQLLDHRAGKGKYQSNEKEEQKRYWPDLSPEFLAKQYEQRKSIAAVFEQIEQDDLSAENRINYAIIKAQLDNKIAHYHYKSHYIPFKSESGFHSSINFTVDATVFKNKKDIEQYINKLAAMPTYFEQNIDWMRKGLAEGITQPQAVLVDYEHSISAFIPEKVEQSVFLKPFATSSTLLDAEFIQEQRERLVHLLTTQIIPAYENYYQFFTQEYLPNARKNIAVSSTPNGLAYYNNRVKHYTTTDMSAEEIHQLGLREVARIRLEMDEVIAKTGFEGTFTEFTHFLRTDPQFYAKTPLALIKEASYLAKQIDGKLPSLFKHLPRTPYGVVPVPDSIAPKYTTGRYISPPNDRHSGSYWVNTYALDKRPLYVLPALTLHEGVPGHHLQISLNSELDNLPTYRQHAYISAFGEGWGLYAEWLGIEAGIYTDHYSNFGRLTYEMWRAARLVVDTGMHVKGWSRAQAMDFMRDNTALSLHNVKTEIDRYISWPGQALSYKIGEITIRKLRKRAETELGLDFDVREFHYQILKNGSVPLYVLEAQIEKYITEELAGKE